MTRLSKGGIHLILCFAPLRVFIDCHQCRSSPANLVLYGSDLGWSCAGSLYWSFEVGPEYHLERLVGFGEGGRWVVSLQLCRLKLVFKTALLICQDHRVCELRKHFSFLFTPFFEDFQQPKSFCCNRSTTNFFMISFLSRLVCCSWVSWWGGQLERREELFLGAACVLCSLFCSAALVLLALLVL